MKLILVRGEQVSLSFDTSMTLREALQLLVSAIHFRPEKANLPRNKAVLLTLVETALMQGADLVVAPELALSGYAFLNAAEASPHTEMIPGPFTAAVQGLTQNHGGTVVVGMAERDPSSSNVYNSAVVIESSGVVGWYRQSHWGSGPYTWASSPPIPAATVDTQAGPIDVMICADIMRLGLPFPGQPPNLLTVPANWNDDNPTAPCLDQWESIVRHRMAPLVIANRYGDETYSDGRPVPFSATISCIMNDRGYVEAASRLPHDQLLFARL